MHGRFRETLDAKQASRAFFSALVNLTDERADTSALPDNTTQELKQGLWRLSLSCFAVQTREVPQASRL